jgi:hypothetical protein
MEEISTKFIRYIGENDDLISTVLKGHLLIEEELELIINNFLPNAEAVNKAKFSFFNKTALAQAICWKWPDDEMWSLIFAINTLRNDLAHNLESNRRSIKFDEVLRQHAQMSENDPDYKNFIQKSKEYQLRLAFAHVLGFLDGFKQDVEKSCQFLHSVLRRKESLLNESATDG